MSMIVFPGPGGRPAEESASQRAPRTDLDPPNQVAKAPRARRRGSVEQGRALEILGHAVEYLVDSRLFLAESSSPADQQAVQLLMCASRAVFAECPEVISVRRRLREWLAERLTGDAA